jgi:hypothetical protein
MRAVHLFPALFFCACVTDCPASLSDVQGEGVGNPEKTQAADAKPFTREQVSQKIGEVYLSLLDTMTGSYFRNSPDLDREHTQAMRRFILEQETAEQFAVRMLSSYENQSIPRSSQTISECGTMSEFSANDLAFLTRESERMAMMMIRRQRILYVAKFVDKDPLRPELLTMDPEGKYTEWIEMVGGEVSRAEMIKNGAAGPEGYEYKSGDRFFFFMSSPQSWEDLCGRMGYLIVRDGKIIEVYVTMMN